MSQSISFELVSVSVLGLAAAAMLVTAGMASAVIAGTLIGTSIVALKN